MVPEQIINHVIFLKQITSEIYQFVFVVWKPLGCTFPTYILKPQVLGNLRFIPQMITEIIMYRHELGAWTPETPNTL